MKRIKKLSLMIVAFCLISAMSVIESRAAEGTLKFTQQEVSTAAGQDVTVTFVISEVNSSILGDVDAVLTYDPEILEYVRGTSDVSAVNVTGADGTVMVVARGTGSETEYRVDLVFHALVEGTTFISSEGVEGGQNWLYNDETLSLTYDTAAVTVSPDGAGSAGPANSTSVELGGVVYETYEDFTDALIPEGFSRTTVQYNGASHNGIMQDVSGETFLFLVTGGADPILARYEASAGKFMLAAQVDMADGAYLLILGEADGSTLPEYFAQTTLNFNGAIFPAWQNMNSTDYYLMYGLSYTGTLGYYQYDSVEHTYQRFDIQAGMQQLESKDSVDSEVEADQTLLGQIKGFVDNYFLIIAGIVGGIVLLLLIILVVMAVKLGHRNVEIDDLYDELDNLKKRVKKNTAPKRRKIEYEEAEDADYEEDDFADEKFAEYEDEEYDDDGYDVEVFGDDEFDDGEEYEEDEFDDEEFGSGQFEEDEVYDEEDYDADEFGDGEDYEEDEFEDEEYVAGEAEAVSEKHNK